MPSCHFCGQPINDLSEDTFREVVSWVSGPKLDSPVLRQQTGRLAHGVCIEKLKLGQAPDQEPLLPEGE